MKFLTKRNLLLSAALFLCLSFANKVEAEGSNGPFCDSPGSYPHTCSELRWLTEPGEYYSGASLTISIQQRSGESWSVGGWFCLREDAGGDRCISLPNVAGGPFTYNIPGGPSFNRISFNATGLNIINFSFDISASIQSAIRQCSDGDDNDGDGLTDYPNDPGCADPYDDDEWHEILVPGAPPVCRPATQDAYLNTDVYLSVGMGMASYFWSSGGNPATGSSPNFVTQFNTEGNHGVTITTDTGSDTCRVLVGINPTSPPPAPKPPETEVYALGSVYADFNKNAVRDPGEPGILNASVQINGWIGRILPCCGPNKVEISRYNVNNRNTLPDGSYEFIGKPYGDDIPQFDQDFDGNVGNPYFDEFDEETHENNWDLAVDMDTLPAPAAAWTYTGVYRLDAPTNTWEIVDDDATGETPRIIDWLFYPNTNVGPDYDRKKDFGFYREHTLTVTKSGTGTGTVTSDFPGINCGATCSHAFPDPMEVTLTASVSEGNSFIGWSGSGCSGIGTCTVTMDQAKSVDAAFTNLSGHIVLNPVALTFNANENGPAPAAQITNLSNNGAASFNWTATTNMPWCHVNPISGAVNVGSSTPLSVTVDAPSNVGTFNCTVTVSANSADNSPQTVAVTYTVGSAPVITSVVGAICPPRHTINWNDVAGETSYNVWFNTANTAFNYGAGDGWTSSPNLAANATSWLKNSGFVTGSNYWYIVTATDGFGGSQSASNGPTPAQACTSNLTNSTKTIYEVNGQAYGSNIVIKTGDTVTFRVGISNSGPSDATVHHICDIPSSNFINLANAGVTGGGGASATVDNSPDFCLAGEKEIDISGVTLAAGSSRTIEFDAQFNSVGAGNVELCSNRARIVYNDDELSNKSHTENFGPVLCNKGASTIPGFLEVAP